MILYESFTTWAFVCYEINIGIGLLVSIGLLQSSPCYYERLAICFVIAPYHNSVSLLQTRTLFHPVVNLHCFRITGRTLSHFSSVLQLHMKRYQDICSM